MMGTISYWYHANGWDPAIWGRIVTGTSMGFDLDVSCNNPGWKCGWTVFADSFYLVSGALHTAASGFCCRVPLLSPPSRAYAAAQHPCTPALCLGDLAGDGVDLGLGGGAGQTRGRWPGCISWPSPTSCTAPAVTAPGRRRGQRSIGSRAGAASPWGTSPRTWRRGTRWARRPRGPLEVGCLMSPTPTAFPPSPTPSNLVCAFFPLGPRRTVVAALASPPLPPFPVRGMAGVHLLCL
jgi:hypothetical protein